MCQLVYFSHTNKREILQSVLMMPRKFSLFCHNKTCAFAFESLASLVLREFAVRNLRENRREPQTRSAPKEFLSLRHELEPFSSVVFSNVASRSTAFRLSFRHVATLWIECLANRKISDRILSRKRSRAAGNQITNSSLPIFVPSPLAKLNSQFISATW